MFQNGLNGDCVTSDRVGLVLRPLFVYILLRERDGLNDCYIIYMLCNVTTGILATAESA